MGGTGQMYDRVQKQDKSKFVLATEACNGYALGTSWVGPRAGEWGYGYAYSHDVLWQLRNGAAGWVDWNLLLDEKGGPNLAGNFVDSAVVATGNASFFANPSFYHIAHFSRYVPPGSKQTSMNVTCHAREPEYCQAVAFRTPAGQAVVVLTNDEITVGPVAGAAGGLGRVAIPTLAKGQGSLTIGTKTLSYTISCGGRSVSSTIPWKAIQTVVMPC